MNIRVLDRRMVKRDVVMFFVGAVYVYIIPFLLADYRYIDDNWRSLTAGTAWTEQGRVLNELFYNVLTFSSGAPDIFPLPLLIVSLIVAYALANLTLHYYEEVNISRCLVVLPIWYNPFFLQNLSYQYDGPAMALSMVAVIYAVTVRMQSTGAQLLFSGGMVAAGMALYQPSINVFCGLCCIEVFRAVNDGKSFGFLRSLTGWKIAQLGMGLMIYYLTAYQLMSSERTALLALNGNAIDQVISNFSEVTSKIKLLFIGGNFWLFWSLLILASAGWGVVIFRVLRRSEALLKTLGLIIICILTVGIPLVFVSGIALVFKDFNEGARTLIGFSIVLVLLLYLSGQFLERVHSRLSILLAIPLLSMLSLSYAYGRVVSVQKEFGLSAVFALEHDLVSHKELRDAKRVYMAINYSDHWLPAGSGSVRTLPILNYILNVNFFMLSENLARVGITNVVREQERRNATLVGYGGYVPMVDSKFYNIYLIGDYGFIVMKEPPRLEPIRY